MSRLMSQKSRDRASWPVADFLFVPECAYKKLRSRFRPHTAGCKEQILTERIRTKLWKRQTGKNTWRNPITVPVEGPMYAASRILLLSRTQLNVCLKFLKNTTIKSSVLSVISIHRKSQVKRYAQCLKKRSIHTRRSYSRTRNWYRIRMPLPISLQRLTETVILSLVWVPVRSMICAVSSVLR